MKSAAPFFLSAVSTSSQEYSRFKPAASFCADKAPAKTGRSCAPPCARRARSSRSPVTVIVRKSVEHAAPLYNDFRAEYGGGFLYHYTFPGRIAQCGVENLRAESVWVKGKGPKDEKDHETLDDLKHADVFVEIDKAENCWVRDCACVDF